MTFHVVSDVFTGIYKFLGLTAISLLPEQSLNLSIVDKYILFDAHFGMITLARFYSSTFGLTY